MHFGIYVNIVYVCRILLYYMSFFFIEADLLPNISYLCNTLINIDMVLKARE